MKFKALIDGVHFDPKKGAVKIVLIAASHVSLDELTTIGPSGKSIKVTLESPQIKIEEIGNPTSEEIEMTARKLRDDIRKAEEDAIERGGEEA